jgi:arylsulfatase A-like enzyme
MSTTTDRNRDQADTPRRGRAAGVARGAARARRAALALALLVGAGACGGSAPVEDGPRPNVLMVLIDTLRADRLGCYGNPRGLSPALDALAKSGVVFEAASAHAPWTLPSTASLLTGRTPAEHGAGGHLGAFTRLGRGTPTVQGHFRRAGHATAAVVNVSFLGPDFGLARGFEHHDLESFESNREVRRADATTDAALVWLRAHAATAPEQPFFLLAHYFDPHAVYDPPQPFRARFALEPDQGDDGLVFGTREHMIELRAGRLALDPEVVRRAAALYDAEVAFTDSELGRLLAGLDELGLAERTIVVATSDHGEEFLDHGGFEHGHTLYAELTHVPLIVRAPGLAPGRVRAGVGLSDVAPTLCALAGLEPLEGASGRNLEPLLAGSGAGHPVLALGNFWGPPLASWRTDRMKLIRNAAGSGRGPELYRWRDDPSERRDLAAEHPEQVDALAAELAAAEVGPAGAGEREAVELDDERRRELQSLGYLGEDDAD